jgi:hypothetical protein
MNNRNDLEQYLFELEKYLSDLGPSDRSKIIVSTEQHIQDALQKYSDKTLADILDDLGPAQKVANHHRLDLGLKTFKPERHPILKWLSITILGSMGLFLIFILTLVWKFTPIFEIDEEKQRIVILGGLIDINGVSGKVKIMDEYRFVENKFANQFDGSIDYSQEEYDEVVINFKSGILTINPATEAKLSWNCKLEVPPNSEFIDRSSKSVVINLEQYNGISCDISIPHDTSLTIDGKDAQVTINNAQFDTFVEINNGIVYFNNNPEVEYKYELNVKNGIVSNDFQSSKVVNAYEIKINVKNGSISRQ